MNVKFLKLNATTDEDLKVISAHLQDGITQAGNIVHLKKNRIFLMQFSRFMWEDVEKGVFRKNKRIRTVIKFENVINVMSKNINQNIERFLDFLTIKSSKNPNENYNINLIFSGDIIIKLEVEAIEVTLDDQGSPWESKNRPKHKDI